MKVSVLKKVIPFVIFLAVLASFSSCNRGVGCPTFSAGDVVSQCVEMTADMLIRP